MLPNGEKVFCKISSVRDVRALFTPPTYTVQFDGLLWLYTSSKVNGFTFSAMEMNEKKETCEFCLELNK